MLAPTVGFVSLLAAVAAADPSATPADGVKPGPALAESLDHATTLASTAPQPARAAPAIVTVIDREEIVAMGARDLEDILLRVPGVSFAQDVEGAIGLGFRGIWGHEGRALLLVDGHEINDVLSRGVAWANHFPADLIERVEVLRGPGSALYGGGAELAVVRVVTSRGKSLDGARAAVHYGLTAGGLGHRGLSLTAGKEFKWGLEVSASAAVGEARLSDGDHRDFRGNHFSLQEDAAAAPALFTVNAAYQGLEVGFLYDTYRYADRVSHGANLPHAVTVGFPGTYLHASWRLPLTPELSVTPRFEFKRQNPRQVLEEDPDLRASLFRDDAGEKLGGSVVVLWKAWRHLDVSFGGELFFEQAHYRADPEGLSQLAPAEDFESPRYRTAAAFAELASVNPVLDVTAGVRVEEQEVFGSEVVPRLALTRALGPVQLKVLYAKAFKAPPLSAYAANPEIEAERADVYEAEVGWLATRNLNVRVNLFDVNLEGPIVRAGAGDASVGTYVNAGRLGDRGVEAEIRWRSERAAASATYSYYTVQGRNEVPGYAVGAQSGALLGLPQHKITVNATAEVWQGIYLGGSAVLVGDRWAVTGSDAAGQESLGRLEPALLLDLNVGYRGRALGGVGLQLAVYNALGDRFAYAQPYRGGIAPLSAMPREFMLKVSYQP